MSLSGIFAIGLSGVTANSTRLEAISSNVANSGTTGYKSAQTDFSTLITAEAPGGGLIGGGVDASRSRLVNAQGAIERTASSTNIAVNGAGFFVVADPQNDATTLTDALFTRSGAFEIRADGLLQNAAGQFLQGAPTDANGVAAASSFANLESVNALRIPEISEPTTLIEVQGNLAASATPGDTVRQSLTIYDANGAARPAEIVFLNGAGGWTGSIAYLDGALETIAQGTISFDASGRIDVSSTTFPTTASVSGQSLTINLENFTSLDQSTSLTNLTANGAPLAALNGVEIRRDGQVVATYANGLSRTIYRIPLALFTNAEGLDDAGETAFRYAGAAGDVALSAARTGSAGAIEGAALELSTVDISQAFAALIETQRAYSANARIITTADEFWRTISETAA